MFDNIGSKLKKYAKISTILGIIGYVISGIAMMRDSFLTGLLVMVLGSLLSWIASFTIYGLGHLIENTDELVKQGRMAAQPPIASAPQPAPVPTPAAQAVPTPVAPAQVTPPTAPHSPSVISGSTGLGEGIVRCPHCGTFQNKGDVCRYCNEPMAPAPVNSTPAPAPQPAQAQPMASIPAEKGKVACPVCGTVQNANRRVCLHCAQPLIPTQP